MVTLYNCPPPALTPSGGRGFREFPAILSSRLSVTGEYNYLLPGPVPRGRIPLLMSRTREEVEATLQIAKLNVQDLRSTMQYLSFNPAFNSGDYCLMELDDALCKEIETGGSLVIRGDKSDHAVLCSQSKTYDLKIADTSNLLLFMPDCKTPEQLPADQQELNVVHCEIAGFSNHYWELRRCRPKLKKLKKLLMENAYEGPENEMKGDGDASLYTTEDLLNQIQASNEELLQHLEAIHACSINGFWRMLDFDYEMKILNHVTQLVDSESWSFSRVPLKECLQELRPLEPEEMIAHCLNCYGEKLLDEDVVYFDLDEDKICRATAQMLLQNAVKFNLSEFQEVWQQSVPEGVTTRMDQLKGLALVDRTSRPETVCLLKTEDLHEDTQERFNSLFTLREKWTEADIAPYIQDLCGEKQTIGALLTKYARSSTQNGVKLFNSRRPLS